MTKRSALLLAGGVAVALMAGLAAVTVNMGILNASEGVEGPGKLGPVVKTITVEKEIRVPAETKTVVLDALPVAPAGGAASSSGGSGEIEDRDDHESEGGEEEHGYGEDDDD